MSAEVPPSIVPVRSLDALRRGDAGYAGRKGANLGELMSAGVPVPPGFVVGAPAYAELCQETGVRGRSDELLGTVDVEDTAALEAAASRAREIVCGASAGRRSPSGCVTPSVRRWPTSGSATRTRWPFAPRRRRRTAHRPRSPG